MQEWTGVEAKGLAFDGKVAVHGVVAYPRRLPPEPASFHP